MVEPTPVPPTDPAIVPATDPAAVVTAAPMRRRAETRVKRDDEIPPDPTETGTFALPSDIYSDEAGAAGAAATADTTAVYISSGGGTVQLHTQVTDVPVATEVDPVAEGTVAATQSAEFAPYGNPTAPYGNPTAMQGESALSSYSVGTVSVDTAAPATPSADPKVGRTRRALRFG